MTLGAAANHCGSSSGGSVSSGGDGSDAGAASAAPGADRGGSKKDDAGAEPGVAPSPSVLDPNASGVILVHASENMPAFRLCFGNSGVAGNLIPLPDRELMPQSNVVGVDVGSAVRLKPFADVGLTIASNGGVPHTVYAIPEKYLRPTLRPANTPCAALICPGLGGDCLDADQFYTIGTLPAAAYAFGVHVLDVFGCVPGSGDVASCGPDFDAVKGNAKIGSIDLKAYTRASSNDFLVQILQLSTPLATEKVSVSFGALSTPGTTLNVSATFDALSPAQPAALAFDRTAAGIYTSEGFRLEAAGLSVPMSLASIQEISDPSALPADFYGTRSSFVMLLLGNPADTAPSGGLATPTTDPGKVLHLLGVPVGQPYEMDGGVDGSPYDASKD
jgi:hypothetical protein